ncbi:iroquois-class homeodomain protein IRX-6-like isoform X1 [Centruroides vittatus]|uniref:iroquois-class homeodomain protein IRX-6-like isoform X1 n=2 Tax=Centruroides vittatus TaxID=120091 RepID=UPI0035102BC8
MSYTQFGYSAYQASQLVVGSSSQTSTSATCCDPSRSSSTTTVETASVTPTPVCPLPAAYDSRILSTYPRLATGLTATPTFYNGAHYASEQAGYANLSAAVETPFYSTLNAPDPWRGITQTSPYYYDSTLAAYGYGGLDLNGSRRKNVTRDSTSTLKAWLNEHRKNPYPTKGEKIMLAIITKMTLTQVSTWFANARRRLKKENKMTWEPRNKAEDDADGAADRDTDDDQLEGDSPRINSTEDGIRRSRDCSESAADTLQMDILNDGDTGRLDHMTDDHTYPSSVEPACGVSLSCPELKDEHDSGYSGETRTQTLPGLQSLMESSVKTEEQMTSKPKIWSLADTATSKSPPPTSAHVGAASYCGDSISDSTLTGGHCGWFSAPTYSTGTPTTGGHYQTGGGSFVHGFSPIPPQTDTPPQTPPSMKLHHGSGYLTSQQGSHLYTSSGICAGNHIVSGQVDKSFYHMNHVTGLGRTTSYRSECLLDDYSSHAHYRTAPIQ